MRKTMMIGLVVIFGCFVLACSGEDDPDGLTNNDDNDAGYQDADVNGGDEDVNGECVPVDECSPGICGEVDDGCGGTFDCGECACEEGVAVDETCGACDLGLLTCEPGETGVGVCDEPDIPGFSGDCDELVFVNLGVGSSSGAGTMQDPLDSLPLAIDEARSKDAVAVILAGGAGVEYEGPVILEEPLSIIGGYRTNWKRDTDNSPVIRSSESAGELESGDIVGVYSKGVLQRHRLEHITIKTTDVVAAGRTNYGIYVNGSPGLELYEVEVQAGKGGDGDSGSQGADGEDGVEGDSAGMRSALISEPGDPVAGGHNPACPDADGGAGGLGEYETNYPTDGESTDGADGGRGGVADSASHGPGEDGEDAEANLTPGDNGQGGSGIGSVVDGKWVSDGAGLDGEQGPAGFGGGGGGGAMIAEDDSASVGAAGGGGGSGGCGGAGGSGGMGGGASFGLFVLYSDIEIWNSGFSADLGGEGGDGGEGGLGGQGAPGGDGMTEYYIPGLGGNPTTYYNYTHTGGDGGAGGQGGRGGHGGGGAGGPSFGAYCAGSHLEVHGPRRFSAAGHSQGGLNPAHAGEDGASIDEYQCE